VLILSRRTGESVMVGDDVVVTVLGIQGNQVSLGVSAPPTTAVHRQEIARKVHASPAGRLRPPRQRGMNARFHR